ncbi:unnamed protein product [Cylicocyclus nassatus]|uniref:C2H2-type domain-containing protein n=1 Tax=Cylicocyclus nassatus TaxID=53992 RepID=A0AA36M258_CYLNA|nr:unnamed protein product [Cylicocyclus nassatus]
MSLHYMEDVSSLYPQIPTSLDEASGLMKALRDGTDEVKGLLKYSCNIILECRCCRAVFRHPENFRKHKNTVCHAYHRPLAPSYEQVISFRKKIAAMYDPNQPTSSKLFGDGDDGVELVIDDTSYYENYDGMEELCGYDPEGSPEPGELVLLPEEGMMVCGVEEIEDDFMDEVEEGEYLPEGNSQLLIRTSSPAEISCCTAEANSRNSTHPNNSADDSISLTESPPHGPIDIALFNENLLESPTESDYFGKERNVIASTFSLSVAK